MASCPKSNGVSLRVIPKAVQKKQLRELNPTKAQGPDMVPPRILKAESFQILNFSYNKSLESGKIPEDWKTADFTAVSKNESRSEPDNFRQVSLTCVLDLDGIHRWT